MNVLQNSPVRNENSENGDFICKRDLAIPEQFAIPGPQCYSTPSFGFNSFPTMFQQLPMTGFGEGMKGPMMPTDVYGYMGMPPGESRV